jgi:hypothetical protein
MAQMGFYARLQITKKNAPKYERPVFLPVLLKGLQDGLYKITRTS